MKDALIKLSRLRLRRQGTAGRQEMNIYEVGRRRRAFILMALMG